MNNKKYIFCMIIIVGFLFVKPSSNHVSALSDSFSENFLTTAYMDSTVTNSTSWGTGAIKNPMKELSLVGTGLSPGFDIGICVDGDYAYIADAARGLQVVDISDLSSPSYVTEYSLGTSGYEAWDVRVDGDVAYITNEENGLVIFDISDPTSLVHLKTYATPDYASRLDIAGDYVFLVEGLAGLEIINVTDPSNPTTVGTYNSPGSACDVYVDRGYAFVADGSEGLQVIDVSDVTNPIKIGGYNTAGSSIGVDGTGDYVFIADDERGIYVFDVTDPTSPSAVRHYDDSTFSASDVKISGNILYVTEAYVGLSIFEIEYPNNLNFIGNYSTTIGGYRVWVEGANAFITDGSGFKILKVSDIVDMTIVKEVSHTIQAGGIDFAGKYAYVCMDKLMIYDISIPSNPVYVSNYSHSGSANDVEVRGDYAFMTYGGAFVVVDISDPESPHGIDGIAMGGMCRLDVVGNYAYVTNELAVDMLYIIDISNPYDIIEVASISAITHGLDVVVDGNYAYVATREDGLQVVDITNLGSPTIAGSYYPGYYVYGISVLGNYAYLSAGYNGLIILDISDPTTPSLVNTIDINAPEQTSVIGDLIYIACEHHGLKIYDVTNPLAPAEVDSLDGICEHAPSIYGNYVYISNSSASTDGFSVIEFSKNRLKQREEMSIAQSSTVLTTSLSSIVYKAILTTADSNPLDTSITYYLSATNGSDWDIFIPGVEQNFFSTGNQIKWKAILETSNTSRTPIIFYVAIDISAKQESPSLISPDNDYVTNDSTPTFEWENITGAKSYLFQLASDSDFNVLIINITVPSSQLNFTVLSPLEDNEYYWRVAAIDIEDDLGYFTELRRIVIQVAIVPEFTSNNSLIMLSLNLLLIFYLSKRNRKRKY